MPGTEQRLEELMRSLGSTAQGQPNAECGEQNRTGATDLSAKANVEFVPAPPNDPLATVEALAERIHKVIRSVFGSKTPV